MTKKWMDAGKLRWCWLQLGDAALMLQEFRKEGHDSWVPDGKVGLGVSLCFRCKDAVAIYREVRARGIEACARRGSPDPAAPRTDRSVLGEGLLTPPLPGPTARRGSPDPAAPRTD
ncbi:MAG: hypothetical protein GW867_13010, partial [Armatimonadetes bacterium]|nr:hypothetical protein [Armatimonadota bacterium]